MNQTGLFGRPNAPLEKLVNTIAGIRELVQRVWQNPYDEEARLVLADWCAEKAFEIASIVLRHEPDVETQAILSALRLLFGDVGAADRPLYGTGRYEAILGLPPIAIHPGETVVMSGASPVFVRIRRIVVSALGVGENWGAVAPRHVHVHSARFGATEKLMGTGVPGHLLQLDGPELFDVDAVAGAPITIVVENMSDRACRVHVTLLGSYVQLVTERTPVTEP